MKTPLLFDVPKSATKLESLKLKHGIETHFSSNMCREDHPWIACHMPKAREIASHYEDGDVSKLTMGALFAGYCRLLDEAGVEATGETEPDAVFRLCKQLNIPCIL